MYNMQLDWYKQITLMINLFNKFGVHILWYTTDIMMALRKNPSIGKFVLIKPLNTGKRMGA